MVILNASYVENGIATNANNRIKVTIAKILRITNCRIKNYTVWVLKNVQTAGREFKKMKDASM